jgi:O-antigen/teichoic acid export membrane protein/SAM-dependent methyltransferase
VTSAVAESSRHACPACRQAMSGPSCVGCGRTFPNVAGLPDFRLNSDRYLELDAERAKAERLARIAESTDLEGVARAYYAMTPDVDPPRCARYLAHILGAEPRGAALACALTDDGPILEIGCGTGGLLVAASCRGLTIEGVDIASRWLVVARRRLQDRGLDVPLTVASAERLPWPDASFATVVADSLIEHCDDPVEALQEWRRVLRPGGRLLIWSPNRFALATDPHVRLWGLGYLPRPWAGAYVRIRRGGAWIPRTLSAWGAARLARWTGFEGVEVGPPSIPREWAQSRPIQERRLLFLYERLSKFLLPRVLLTGVGPLWALDARVPAYCRGGTPHPTLPHKEGGKTPDYKRLRVDSDQTVPPPLRGRVGWGVKTPAHPDILAQRSHSRSIRPIHSRGLAVCLIAEVLAGVVGFIATIHLARRLGPEGFTTLEVAAATAGWLLVLVRSGLDQIVVREAARRPRLIGRLTGELLALRCLWAVIGLALIAGVAGWQGSRTLIAAGLVLVPSAFVADVGPRARNELGFLAILQVLRALGMVAFVWILVASPRDLLAAASAPAVAETLVALVCAIRASRADGWPWPRWRARAAIVLSRRAIVAGLIRFGRVGLYAADAMALGLASGVDRGGYAAGRRLVFALVAVGVVVPTLFAPSLARAWQRGAAEASTELRRGLVILLGLFIPTALGLWLLADLILPALFGSQYQQASPLLGLVAARLPVLLAATWFQSALVAFGREAVALRLTLMAAVVAVILLPIAAVTGGPLGIGWAVLSVEAVLAVGGWIALRWQGIGGGR